MQKKALMRVMDEPMRVTPSGQVIPADIHEPTHEYTLRERDATLTKDGHVITMPTTYRPGRGHRDKMPLKIPGESKAARRMRRRNAR